MPRKCSTCDHANNAEISKALARGDSIRSISSRYSLSSAAVQRHLVGCLRIRRSIERSKSAPSWRSTEGTAPSSRFDPDDGRCRSCGQLVAESTDGRLEPKDLIRRSERSVWLAENVAARALDSDDLRLVLQALDRIRVALDTLLRVHGLMNADSPVADNRTVNIFQGWDPADVRALLAKLPPAPDSEAANSRSSALPIIND
jgi:hypothetical protein